MFGCHFRLGGCKSLCCSSAPDVPDIAVLHQQSGSTPWRRINHAAAFLISRGCNGAKRFMVEYYAQNRHLGIDPLSVSPPRIRISASLSFQADVNTKRRSEKKPLDAQIRQASEREREREEGKVKGESRGSAYLVLWWAECGREMSRDARHCSKSQLNNANFSYFPALSHYCMYLAHPLKLVRWIAHQNRLSRTSFWVISVGIVQKGNKPKATTTIDLGMIVFGLVTHESVFVLSEDPYIYWDGSP